MPIEVKSRKDYKTHSALNNLLKNETYNVARINAWGGVGNAFSIWQTFGKRKYLMLKNEAKRAVFDIKQPVFMPF